jgi:hypothetical protein
MAPGKYDDNHQGLYDIHPVFAVSITTVSMKATIFLDTYEYKWIYVEPE